MARYQTLQVHSASNPSICEVYFVISSSRVSITVIVKANEVYGMLEILHLKLHIA